MGAVFLRILNMSVTASWLIAAVILLRFLLKKAPKWISCVLWAFVAIRLICPFSVESAWSLVPDKEPVSEFRMPVRDVPQTDPLRNADAERAGSGHAGGMESAAKDAAAGAAASENTQNIHPTAGGNQGIRVDVLGMIWICGAAAMLFYSLISYGKLHKCTAVSAVLEGQIRQCDAIETPFILGIVRPRIYLPSDLEETQTEYVIAHERAHLKRRDHWWKPIGFLILSIHWFNPLCWISYALLCRDIELACDESVIRTENEQYKKSYAEALFACSVGSKRLAACPLAFGEVGVKIRVRNVMNYRKPGFWIVPAAAAACLVVAVCFLTNPQNKGERQVSRENEFASRNEEEFPVWRNEEELPVWRNEDGDFAGADGADDPGNETGRGNAAGTGDRSSRQDAAGSESMSGRGDQAADADGIPDAVWEAARSYVQSAFDRTKEDSGQPAGNSYTDWRIQSLAYCHTYDQIAGMTCDIYRLNYEFLAESPEDVIPAGGMSQSEDGWVVPESPNSHYLVFVREGDTLSYFCGMYENDCEPGDELFTSDLIDYCLEAGLFDESEGFHPNGQELIRRMMEVDVETLHTVPFTQDITGSYKGVDVDVTREDGAACRARILCIGELPEQGIRLYGYDDELYAWQGVIVEKGNDIAYFDWGYMTPRIQFPKLYWNEKENQLQITLPIYTGTTFASEKLVVLQYDEKGCVEPYDFRLEEFTALVNSILGYRFDEQSGTLAIIDKRTDEVAATFTNPGENVYGIWSGDISEFILGDTILFRVTPGYLTDAAAPQYDDMPSVEFEVEITDDGGLAFTLGALRR